jgi:glycerophosphoryl diester phosphodiesterase
MLSLLACVVALGSPADAPAKPYFDRPILLGFHRAGAISFPENTVHAFREAGRRYPDAILETDVTLSSDGHAVLLHDPTVNRTTDGNGYVTKMTLAELQRLDAAYKFTLDGGKTFPLRGRGISVPTLEEALLAAPKSRFLLDIKGGAREAEAAVAVVRRLGAEDRVMWGSFIPAAMAKVRELQPNAPHLYDMPQGLKLLGALRGGDWGAYRPQADVLSVMKEHVAQYKITPEEVRAIREKGIRFQIHTLNTAEEIRHWLEIGVDSILTDDADLLAREIAAFSRE